MRYKIGDMIIATRWISDNEDGHLENYPADGYPSKNDSVDCQYGMRLDINWSFQGYQAIPLYVIQIVELDIKRKYGERIIKQLRCITGADDDIQVRDNDPITGDCLPYDPPRPMICRVCSDNIIEHSRTSIEQLLTNNSRFVRQLGHALLKQKSIPSTETTTRDLLAWG